MYREQRKIERERAAGAGIVAQIYLLMGNAVIFMIASCLNVFLEKWGIASSAAMKLKGLTHGGGASLLLVCLLVSLF